jgi:hypothetical protein
LAKRWIVVVTHNKAGVQIFDGPGVGTPLKSWFVNQRREAAGGTGLAQLACLPSERD